MQEEIQIPICDIMYSSPNMRKLVCAFPERHLISGINFADQYSVSTERSNEDFQLQCGFALENHKKT